MATKLVTLYGEMQENIIMWKCCLWGFVPVNSNQDFVRRNVTSEAVIIYYCCCYYSYNGESETSKTKSFSLFQPTSSQRHRWTKIILCQSITCALAVFTPVGNWAQSSDSALGCPGCPRRGQNHVTPQPVHLHSEEVRELPWCLAWKRFEAARQWGRLFPLPCDRELVLFPGAWKRATLLALSRMDPVCLSWDKARVGLAVLCSPVCWICFDGGLGGEGLLRGLWGCGKEEKWWWFGSVSCWMFRGNSPVNILWSMWK